MTHKRNNCCLTPLDHLHGKGILFANRTRKKCVSVAHVYQSSIGEILVQYIDVLDRSQHAECNINEFKRLFPHPVERVELSAE
ncbi:hypothetical protein LCGC14_1004180 [marine sediment metagenome]|uniref:Uncharacterized protein n=1 Tax=marine sediment metagenome TaxID=412755 RepID=A0A0F9QKG4_9ZZZZ